MKDKKFKKKNLRKKVLSKKGRASSRSFGNQSVDISNELNKNYKFDPKKNLEWEPILEPNKTLESEPKKELKHPKQDEIISIKPLDKETSIDIQIQIKRSPKKKQNYSIDKSEQSICKEPKKEQLKKVQSEVSLTESIDNEPLPVVSFNTLNKNLIKNNLSNKLNVQKLDKFDSSELFTRLYKLKSNKLTSSGFSLGKEKSRSGKECRICLQLIEDESNSLQPCACIGSQAFVHRHCLHEWIRIRGSNKCDVCNKEYTGLNLIKRHRGFLNWISTNPVIFFYLISGLFLGIFFFYILFIGYLEYKTSDGLVVNYLRIILLIISIFYTILFSVVFITLIVKAILLYLSWRQENYTVTLGPLSETLMTLNESVSTSTFQPMIDQMSKNQSNNRAKSISASKTNMPINPSQGFLI